MTNKIKNAPAYEPEKSYQGGAEFYKAINGAAESFQGVQHSTATIYRDFSNLLPGISGKPGLTRSDYDYFRPDEAVPTEFKRILTACNIAYKRVGLIRNIVDLMSDFGSQGICLTHPNPRIQKWYQAWFKKVGGKERSERFLNNLYRLGNVIIRRNTAKISLKAKSEMFALASPDQEIKSLEDIQIDKREIPWKYMFIDPRLVSVVGGPLSSLLNKRAFGIKLPTKLRQLITSAKDGSLQNLPKELINAAKADKIFPLPPDKTLVFHYKKDDWETWADPMIYAVLDNITTLEKLRLADNAVLDTAINNIRIFKIGNLEYKIAPTRAASDKLAAILENNVGAGVTDIIWGPDIELIETSSSVHNFLGEEKYRPTLSAIYAGLGIPQTLTGTANAPGTTNNFISIKTLVERLEYGRNLLTSFWQNEIGLVQKAMDFRLPAQVEYDLMFLGNEEAEKALLIQLADRNLISDEWLQKQFGANPQMEKGRIKKENVIKEKGKAPPKSGPFHPPTVEDNGKPTNSDKGKTPQQGRPKNSLDTTQRKNKKFSPKLKASIEIWAQNAQNTINDILNPAILALYKKKNMRALTNQESISAEKIKFGVLSNIEPLTDITETVISSIVKKSPVLNIVNYYKGELSNFIELFNREPTLEEMRQLQSKAYTMEFISE